MVKECIILGHRISRRGIEVDKEKVDIIEKLPPQSPLNALEVFGACQFLSEIHHGLLKDFQALVYLTRK